MTQEQPKRKPRAAPDEGAAYTKAVMAEVKRIRLSKIPTWSAERLAEEITTAGIPWTRDTVTNLETGRRKWIAAHEVLALAWVLEVSSPVELLAPGEELDLLQVTPEHRAPAGNVRDWFAGKVGPLKNFEKTQKSAAQLAPVIVNAFVELGRKGYSTEQIAAMINEIGRGGGSAESADKALRMFTDDSDDA